MDNERKTKIYIKDFAFCGTKEIYSSTLFNLSLIAEQEPWTVNEDEPNGVLSKYINGTFQRCYSQNKILFSTDKSYCCFNTGLLTPNGNDIMCVFVKNSRTGENVQPWFLKFFADKTERRYMDIFSEVPPLATYTENYEEFYFHPDYDIIISTDHILDDNWERIQSVIPLSKTIVKSLMTGVIEETKIRIKRNLRLVVPQFYNNQIMYLLPVNIPIGDDEFITMALAVELTKSQQYRANTIFTKEMAYEKARLLMKPESNWLL